MPYGTNLARAAIIKRWEKRKKIHDDRWESKASGMRLIIEMMAELRTSEDESSFAGSLSLLEREMDWRACTMR
jgi:hypothetical protein